MDELTYDTLIGYLQTLPGDDNKFHCLESLNPNIPSTWQYLGSLSDPKISFAMESYKPDSVYALGFYPFDGCDIYRDDDSRIRLVYRELGGHAAFLRSFIVTKNSPFVMQPVAFSLAVPAYRNDEFIGYLAEHGLTPALVENDIASFKGVQYIMDIPADRVVIIRRWQDANTFIYAISAPREIAHVISDRYKQDQ